MGESPVQKAAAKIAERLTEMNVPFVIVGGLAVGVHGHLRYTQGVDLLMTREDLARFKERWLGLGWVERFRGSKGLRDTEYNLKVNVLITGDYPGDGKAAPVAFPHPATVADLSKDNFPVLALSALIELKLASGLTTSDRPRDFDDVIQLVRANKLPRDFAAKLNPYVHAKYDELWLAAQTRHEEE